MDVTSIVDRHLISKMREAVGGLEVLQNKWHDEMIPEVEWGRMRALEFQETIRARDVLMARSGHYQCIQCPDFKNHASAIIQEGLLTLTYLLSVSHRPCSESITDKHRFLEACNI